MDPMTMLILGGTAISAAGQAEAAEQALYRGYIQKALNEVAATQVVAIGQRRALEEQRQAELLAKRALAVGAAGGHADDITGLIADINGEGAYRAGVALYEAETEAERLRYEGKLAAEYGVGELKAGQTRQLATVISGAATMSKYNRGTTKKTDKTVPGDAYQPAQGYYRTR